MRKGAAVLAACGLALVGVAGPAQAVPEHAHMLVLGVQYDATGQPVGFEKCVDIAAGQRLHLGAHHEHVHVGRAGVALREAGHLFVPAAPVSPFANCAALEAAFG